MANNLISLDPVYVAPDEDQISIDAGAPNPGPVAPDVANSRAFKMHYGLGSVLEKDYPTIYTEISSGREEELRRQAAANLDTINAERRSKELSELAARGPVDPAEAQQILNKDTALPIDPGSVMEKGYGHAYMNSLNIAQTYMGDTILDEAKADFPKSTEQAIEAGSDIRSKRELLLSLIQNNQQVIDGQSFGTYAWDTAKGFIPLYSQFKQRSNTPSVGALSGMGFLGENIDKQSTAALMMPIDQFQTWATETNAKLMSENPQEAQSFLQGIVGQSKSERLLKNLMTPIDVASLPGAGFLSGAAIRKLGILAGVKKAAVDMAKATGDTPAAMASHAGDAETAAVVKVADEIKQNLNGTVDPVKAVTEPLTSNMDMDNLKFQADPGRFGQEIVNRVNESTSTTKTKLIDIVENTLKIDPAKDVMESPEAQRAIMQEYKDNYRGLHSKVLDVLDPIHENGSNTYWYKLIIGREDGTLFKTREEAMSNAKMNGIVIEARPDELPNLKIAIEDTKREIKEGPAMDADTAELNRHEALPDKLAELENAYKELELRGTGGYQVEERDLGQQGLGYYIAMPMSRQLGGDAVWNNLAKTENFKLQDTWLNSIAGWIRTPEDTASLAENEMRKIATHGPARLLVFAKEAGQAVEKLPGKYWDEWKRAIDVSRKMNDPVDGKPGYFFQTGGELEDFYQMAFKRLPEMSEIEAYFTFKRNVEVDRVFRELSVFRNKANAGAQMHRFYQIADDGTKTFSPWFEGIVQKHLPGGEDTAVLVNEQPGKLRTKKVLADDGETVVKVSQKVGGIRKFSSSGQNALATAERKAVDESLENGNHINIRIYDPDRFPLKGYQEIGEDRVRYVVTPFIETKPLDFGNQVNRRGGPHFDYEYEYRVVQPKVIFDTTTKKYVLIADTTLMPVASPKLGNALIKHFSALQDLIRANRIKEAKDYHDTTFPGSVSFKEHLSNYRKSRNPETGEINRPLIDKDMPFYVVPYNKMSVDVDKNLFNHPKFLDKDGRTKLVDGTRQGSDARQFEVQYTQERNSRDMFTIVDKGSAGNPVYAYQPAQFVDPITTLNRGLNRIIHSTFMDDMKTYSVLHWLKEADKYLKPETADVRHAPFYHFANADFRSGVMEQQTLSNLKSAHMKINDFIGVPSKVDTFVRSMSQKLADSIYEKAGPKAGILAQDALERTRDPLAFLRGVAFHAKMGLGAIPQFFTNFATFANIMAISPAHAAKATTGMLFHQWTRINSSPEVLAHLDKLASRLGWKPGQWLEAHTMLKKTGFEYVGAEHAMLDMPWHMRVMAQPGTKGSIVGKILDFGTIPFKEGSQATRIAAWYTAMSEFRSGGGGKYKWASNATRTITDKDLAEIQNRAALLDHNQSRASSSALHTGVMAPMAQFASYGLRLSEMVYGKRLTRMEKIRLLTASALLWGIPVGTLGITGVNFGDYMKMKAKEYGYVDGDNYVTSTLMNGLPAALAAYISGDGNANSGNWYNFSKWGAKGSDLPGDIIDGDKSMWQIFGGASASILANTWANSDGLRHALANMITSDYSKAPLRLEDFTAMAKEVYTYSALERYLVALHTGNIVSKTEGILQKNVTAMNATFMALLGVTDQRVADLTISSKAIKAQDNLNKEAEKKFLVLMQHHFQAVMDHNDSQADEYYSLARTWLDSHGYPREMRPGLMSRVVRQNEDLVTRLDRSYYTRNLPAGQEADRNKVYKSILQMNKAKANNGNL